MLRFLTHKGSVARKRSGSVGSSRRSTVQLTLERLERRDCPSAGGCFESFYVTPTGLGKQVELIGNVSGTNAADLSITLSGVVYDTITTDDNGSFDVFEVATGLGMIYATPEDPTINSMETLLDVAAPTITGFNLVAYGSQLNRTVTVQGTVSAPNPQGLTVTLGGVLSGSAATDANGNFTYTGNASAVGNATATVTDAWGQTSDSATLNIAGVTPVINNFQIFKNSTGQWVLSGNVTDNYGNNNAAGLTVTFGGSDTLDGVQTAVNSDGSFYLVMNLPAGESSTATAQVEANGWGFSSDVSYDAYSNT